MPLNHRFTLLIVIAALLFKTALCADTDANSISCEVAARRLGQPVDGWKLVKVKNDSETKKNGKGKGKRGKRKEVCVREVTDLQCEPGVETLYYHPETRLARCCQKGGSVTWYDEEAKLGFCCAEGHHWTGNISTGEGGCCTLDAEMVDGECISITKLEKVKPEKKPCGCSSSSSSVTESASESEEGDDKDKEETSDEKVHDLNVPETALGIHYGACYELSLVDGAPVGSNRENGVYTPNGLFPGIPFRVCRSTDDCSETEGEEGMVTSRTPFYLKDTVGRYNDPQGRMGWVGITELKELKMVFSWEEDDAEEFYAMKGTTCGEKECLKLDGLPLELVFENAQCWGEDAFLSQP
ncbi:hypothetical protein L218DRAFT_1003192 [Marasmius fiardii PR-910]|nr:hypothetical protein L218DRAFT_1003192 [Marasmius fiardii PR-910]